MLKRAISRVCLGAVLALALSDAGVATAKEELVSGGGKRAEGFITAGSDGATYRLAGGTEVHLGPGTVARFTSTTRLRLGAANGPLTSTRMMTLKTGRVDVVPASGQKDVTAVLVHGPRQVSAVGKDGRYSMIASNSRVTVAAVRGKVLYGIGKTWRPMLPGHARTVLKTGPEDVRSIVGMARARATEPLQIAIGEQRRPLGFAWKPVAGAKSYEVELRSPGSPPRTLRTKKPRVTFEGAGAGRHAARIRAYDPHGLEGPWSKPAAARVVGVKVPEGGVVETPSIVRITRRQSIELVEAQGLEVSYGRATHFVAAPDRIGLSRGRPIAVRLRAPGDKREARLQLEPNDVSAQIEIGPRSARWPQDDVSVTVRLIDRNGRPAPRSVKPITKVTVNVQETKVRWRRSGAVLRATLRPPQKSGPWVVRVEVTSPTGERLGRDFLEIADSRPAKRPPNKGRVKSARRGR